MFSAVIKFKFYSLFPSMKKELPYSKIYCSILCHLSGLSGKDWLAVLMKGWSSYQFPISKRKKIMLTQVPNFEIRVAHN